MKSTGGRHGDVVRQWYPSHQRHLDVRASLRISLRNSGVQQSRNVCDFRGLNERHTGGVRSMTGANATKRFPDFVANASLPSRRSISGSASDYNLNGVVDAAEYTIWRNTLGSTTDLRANGDNTGATASPANQRVKTQRAVRL
jgi:hypothetical protein